MNEQGKASKMSILVKVAARKKRKSTKDMECGSGEGAEEKSQLGRSQKGRKEDRV